MEVPGAIALQGEAARRFIGGIGCERNQRTRNLVDGDGRRCTCRRWYRWKWCSGHANGQDGFAPASGNGGGGGGGAEQTTAGCVRRVPFYISLILNAT